MCGIELVQDSEGNSVLHLAAKGGLVSHLELYATYYGVSSSLQTYRDVVDTECIAHHRLPESQGLDGASRRRTDGRSSLRGGELHRFIPTTTSRADNSQALLNLGADIDMPDPQSDTPLHFASSFGHRKGALRPLLLLQRSSGHAQSFACSLNVVRRISRRTSAVGQLPTMPIRAFVRLRLYKGRSDDGTQARGHAVPTGVGSSGVRAEQARTSEKGGGEEGVASGRGGEGEYAEHSPLSYGIGGIETRGVGRSHGYGRSWSTTSFDRSVSHHPFFRLRPSFSLPSCYRWICRYPSQLRFYRFSFFRRTDYPWTRYSSYCHPTERSRPPSSCLLLSKHRTKRCLPSALSCPRPGRRQGRHQPPHSRCRANQRLSCSHLAYERIAVAAHANEQFLLPFADSPGRRLPFLLLNLDFDIVLHRGCRYGID